MMGFLLLAIGFCFAIFALSNAFFPSIVTERVKRLESPHEISAKRNEPFFGTGRWVEPLVRDLAFARRIETRLSQARLPWTPGEFLVADALATVGGLILGGFFFQKPLFAFVFALAGGFIPYWWLGKRHRDIVKEFNQQLPDALMLIVNALRAGNSFLQAMQIVSTQLPVPIATEFDRAIHQINWGVPTETALLDLQHRIGTLDIELVVSAVLIQRETGGNLSEILLNIHDSIRDRIRLQGEIQSMTAQGRLSGWILSGLPVGIALILNVISPSYIRVLFSDPRGQAMLAVVGAMQILGIVLIRKVIQIRY